MNAKNKILSAALAVVLSTAFLYATGPAGCGGASSGPSAPDASTSAPATTEQRQQAALQIVSNIGNDPSSNPAALMLGSAVEALALDATKNTDYSFPCPLGGSASGSIVGSNFAVTYDNCHYEDFTINGLATITVTSSHHSTITYSNVTYSTTACGGYGLNGTVVVDSSAASTTTFLPVTVTYNLTTQRGGSSGTITGTITHNSGDTLSGNMNVTNPNFSCTYSNTALTCPALTTACGLSSTSLCNGNDFRTDICSL